MRLNPATIRWLLAVGLSLVAAMGGAADRSPPNILLIILDDQNAFAGRTDLAPQPATPNLSRVAQRGVTFANAQCPAPVCNPSRTALLSGLRPSTTGIYDNSQDSLPADHILNRTVSLPEYFRRAGYKVAGGGKIFGSAFGSAVGKEKWDETFETRRRQRQAEFTPPADAAQVVGKHAWGPLTQPREQLPDWQLAEWAAGFLAKPQPRPFFLACGIVKPHTPWHVPAKYFELFPPDRIIIPALAADETVGVPATAKDKLNANLRELARRRNEAVAAYLAAMRFADDCVGRILDGLDAGPHKDNTLVLVCGDNGYQFGEKNNWSKGGLWEGSANVPLVVAGPGVATGQTSRRPVGLLDLYPTLIELAGLPPKSGLDGTSIAALLKDPQAPWDRPALTTKGFQNHALRSERFRYIRYADGSEELYDHDADPLERVNVAARAEFAETIARLKRWLPEKNEPRNPNPAAGGTADN